MRRILVTAAMALLLAAPSFGNEIVFRIIDEGISFGLDNFTFGGPIETVTRDGVTSIEVEGGFATLVSGPLVNLFEGDGETLYAYGPGTLTIHALFAPTPGDPLQQGQFEATVQGFSFTVCEGCDQNVEGNSTADVFIGLGEGLFDSAFARFLGVSRHSPSGEVLGGFELSLFIEDILGDPSSPRFGASSTGAEVITVDVREAVPEPSLLLLSVVTGVGCVARRRARGGSASRTTAQRAQR